MMDMQYNTYGSRSHPVINWPIWTYYLHKVAFNLGICCSKNIIYTSLKMVILAWNVNEATTRKNKLLFMPLLLWAKHKCCTLNVLVCSGRYQPGPSSVMSGMWWKDNNKRQVSVYNHQLRIDHLVNINIGQWPSIRQSSKTPQ